MIVKRQGDWLAAKVGEELVMMSAEKGNYIGLSEVGTRVWELIEAPQDLDAICAAIGKRVRRDAGSVPRRSRRNSSTNW